MTGNSPDALRQLSPNRLRLLEHLLRQQEQPSRAPLAVSLFFFSSDPDDRPGEKYELLLECAERADRAGLHAIWMPERHFDVFGAPYPSPAILLAAVAARTSRIQLRAGSVVLPLHDPLLVAEEWGVLDAISHQRMGMSLASGWHADDFVLAPDAYEDRKNILLEQLATVRALWRGEGVARGGPGGREVEVRAYPRPERLPDVWLTSSGNPATWETAGQHDLHVLTALLEQTVDELAGKVDRYRRALTTAGHSVADKQITCMLHTHLAADPDAVPDRIRQPLIQYLSQHLRLFEKFAAHHDIGVRPDAVSEQDRAVLLEHGLRRYTTSAGLFGSVETCRPMIDKLVAAGVTEIGCLVDFGLPADQVLECVTELGRLQALVRA
ncbi:natural product biosynthesis luciferase-like monooxygenase domain-containing protein [Micromonospora pallida]|uniref:Natural product biosynthesis luciferase-like monooxygenase domain-containing protein n=1 Tax=Micromonospora pallida TaxID=145854 RepID=A0A1C6SD10_9ACTN|nr:MupA/Atu3671 family FMN-dependent luciferase-like monooxygenase [Micromonospora pallida]SCL27368.1 natural product biosynthesis luciferase-like monooxygenase domain-containing protein [Micromonospora pallida]